MNIQIRSGLTESRGSDTGFRSDGSFQLFRSDLEVLFDAGTYDNGSTFSQLHHFRIAYPVRSRNDYFITFVHQSQNRVADRLLGTIGTADLSGGIFQTVFLLQLFYDGIPQSRISGYGRIA